jgi:hypothetical protein
VAKPKTGFFGSPPIYWPDRGIVAIKKVRIESS